VKELKKFNLCSTCTITSACYFGKMNVVKGVMNQEAAASSEELTHNMHFFEVAGSPGIKEQWR